ncbi:MAG: TIGR04255 family protein [Anaerolineales bacterium]|nr:TIGR04255 family protein [Anaerolineales bacterium]
MMRVKYKNPPINEVIIGAYFDQPVMPLHSEHIGVFWSQIRAELPNIQQQPELTLPIVGPNISIQFGMTDEPYPMPRFWLSSEDGSILLQIQKNAFILNWRRRAGAYPHFENVKKLFDRYFERFLAFLRTELRVDDVNVQVAELTYSNLVEPGSYWMTALDTPRLLPSLAILDVGAPADTVPDFNYVTAYRFAPDLTLNVSVRTGRQPTDANKSVLVFELRTIGALDAVGRAEADLWYERAHETIGRCFTAMTNPDIQRNNWQEV